MAAVLPFLDSREKAIVLWVAIGLGLALRSKDIRGSLASLLRTLLSRPLVTIFLGMGVYSGLALWAAHSAGLWHFGLLKDTLAWLFGPAMVMVFNHEAASRDPNHFKKTVLATLHVGLITEFLVNFYVLPLLLEIVLVPMLLLLGGLLAVAETKDEYMPVKRLAEFLIAAFGLALITYAVARLSGDPAAFFSEDMLRLFFLPVALTLVFMPFLYVLALYSGYEQIFIRLSIWIKDEDLTRYLKQQLLLTCHLQLSRINKFQNEYMPRLREVKTKLDVSKLMTELKTR